MSKRQTICVVLTIKSARYTIEQGYQHKSARGTVAPGEAERRKMAVCTYFSAVHLTFICIVIVSSSLACFHDADGDGDADDHSDHDHLTSRCRHSFV